MVLGDMTSIAQITKHLNLQQKIMKVHIRPEIAVANVRCRHLANIAVKKLLHVKSLHSSVDSSWQHHISSGENCLDDNYNNVTLALTSQQDLGTAGHRSSFWLMATMVMTLYADVNQCSQW